MRLVADYKGDIWELIQVADGEITKMSPADLIGIPAYFWIEWDSKLQHSYLRLWPKPRLGVQMFELKEVDLAAPLPDRKSAQS